MGNRVSTVSDSITIKIGGEHTEKTPINSQNNRIKSTKYSLITFLPQNLLEQFRRIANFYFLIMTIIAIVIDSPVSPLTSLIPLVFVIAVTAAKQGYEDFLRHKADNMVNYSLVTVIRNGTQVDIKCQDIIQGDLVKVARDCDVPCDLVLLKSSDPHGKCHITTANLDGESNLKTLIVPKNLPNVNADRLHTLGVIECEQPRTDLYTFNGRIELGPAYRRESILVNPLSDSQNMLPLMAENLLLRGSRIKNTEWAIGCAVYTGQNTKLALNSRITRNKMSSSEHFINKFLVFFLVLLLTIVTVSYFLKRYFDMYFTEHNLYLGEPVPNFQVSQFLQDYFSFLILFNYLIPISLYVTIEMHKFMGSFFMEWDTDLYDAESNQPFIVNTSDLNEELGQVEILFSDKTGTLTKNEMNLQQCSIKGKMYGYKESGIEDEFLRIHKIHEFKEDMLEFFQTLAVCHTVQVAGNEEEQDENLIQSNVFQEEVETIQTFNSVIKEEVEPVQAPESDADETDFLSGKTNKLNNGNLAKPIELKNMNKLLDPHVRRASRPSSDSTAEIILNETRPHSLILEASNGTDYSKTHFPYPSHVNGFLAQHYRRTHSENDELTAQKNLGHRRTQSYAATTTHSRKYNLSETMRRTSKTMSFIRNSGSELIVNTREYYAAPSYNEAALIERKESVRRKQDIKTVIDKLDYQASSPDEKALVEACAKLGFIFTGDDSDIITIKMQPYKGIQEFRINRVSSKNTLTYERLHTLEFTSDRKRMSVIVRDKRGQIWLFTKGAESHVLPLCTRSDRTLVRETQAHIDEFAKLGLRTLAIARKKLSQEEYMNYHNEITVASNSLTNRKELIVECQAKLENDLQLLGATAVEDALQDNVRDTLESLREAGIKVWVLTGDKVETALNIAISCGHIPTDAKKYFIVECKEAAAVDSHLTILEEELLKHPMDAFALLIDGSSLAIALTNCKERFRDISVKCRAVLCCRLSPMQKCEVVQLIKTVSGGPITASIGDGANDVSMIQEAHVGLGIVGKEGRQAARCADYAFGNFSMLKRLLLVHGHYYSQRLSMLVLYFFYKNLVFMMIQLYFQGSSMFSSQSIYDSIFLTLYNVVYTSLPILFISLTEKVYPEDILMNKPELYKTNTGNKRLTWKYFCGWMLLAVYHSVVIYYFSYAIWNNNPAILPLNGRTVNFSCFGTFLIHNVVILVNLRLWLEAKYQSYWFIFTIIGSIVTFMVLTVIYNLFAFPKTPLAEPQEELVQLLFQPDFILMNFLSYILALGLIPAIQTSYKFVKNIILSNTTKRKSPSKTKNFSGDMLWVYNTLLSSLFFWLLSIIIIVTGFLPDFTLKSLYAINYPFKSVFSGSRTYTSRKNCGESTYL